MASASTLTSVDWIYKRDYSKEAIADITMRDHVWYAKCDKKGDYTGDSFTYTVRYGNPQGVSGRFQTAKSRAGSSKGAKFLLTLADKFGVITMDGKSVMAAKNNRGAFFELVTMETDNILEEVGDSLAYDFYRDTTGVRGRISSIAGNVLSLVEPTDARNFKEQMFVIGDNAANGESPKDGACEIDSVDEPGGTVTVTDISDITGLAVNDYLFREGDPGTCMQGLEVCTPLSAPVRGTDDFRDVDRGRNPNRLAGSRISDTMLLPEQALQLLAVNISTTGRSHNVDEGYLHPTQFFGVTSRMGSKVEYVDNDGREAHYGFESFVIHTAAGPLRIYSDPDCPIDRARVSRVGSMAIKHMGGLPHIVDADGQTVVRQTDDNGIEARVASFSQLYQTDTAAQGVAQLATS
jgi:hypothetical protein